MDVADVAGCTVRALKDRTLNENATSWISPKSPDRGGNAKARPPMAECQAFVVLGTNQGGGRQRPTDAEDRLPG